MRLINKIFSGFFIALILVYRYTLSPIMGRACRFQPSCSTYGMEAIQTHGPWRGLALTICRLARCHPFGGSGYDPVPSFANTKPSRTSAGCTHET